MLRYIKEILVIIIRECIYSAINTIKSKYFYVCTFQHHYPQKKEEALLCMLAIAVNTSLYPSSSTSMQNFIEIGAAV